MVIHVAGFLLRANGKMQLASSFLVSLIQPTLSSEDGDVVYESDDDEGLLELIWYTVVRD